MSDKQIVYINREQLDKLLKDQKFIGFAQAKGSKTVGGCFANSDTFFQLRRNVVA